MNMYQAGASPAQHIIPSKGAKQNQTKQQQNKAISHKPNNFLKTKQKQKQNQNKT